MAPLLSVEGVSKEYHVRGKNVLALDSVDLSANEGEFAQAYLLRWRPREERKSEGELF